MDSGREPAGLTAFKEKRRPSRIQAEISVEKLCDDLGRYSRKALEMGAAVSAVIRSSQVIVDERVRAKCMYPKCGHYGSNANCPPHAPEVGFVRRVVEGYGFAVFFGVEAATEEFTGKGFLEPKKEQNRSKLTLNTICSEIESRAFYDGYYLALALGQGPCKAFWCGDRPCSALGEERTCRFPLKARSSAEALGIDVFRMAARQGWSIYPCGSQVEVAALPHCLLLGLVFVA